MNKLIYAIGMGCTLCACSTVDEPGPGEEQQGIVGSNQFVTVAIVTDANTRAESDYYENGSSNEYDVNSVGFYFFDRQGNCVDTKYLTSAQFKENKDDDGNWINTNPYVTSIATVEVELTASLVYDSMIAVLNPNGGTNGLVSGGKLVDKTKSQVLAYMANYAGEKWTDTEKTKGNFTMSNSVYVDDENFTGKGDFTPAVAVAIVPGNLYTKEKPESEMNDTEKAALAATKAEKAINVYVERVCSKVIVDTKPSFDGYFVDEEGKKTTIDVNFYDPTGAKSTTITVVPEFQGIGLSVTAQNAYLTKQLANPLTFHSDITDFAWNDAKNKRSYWETSIPETNETYGKYNYTKWENLTNPWNKADGTAITNGKFSAYINPNTNDAYTYSEYEADCSTKLMVRAQLKYKINDSDALQNLDLVRYNGGYWIADYFLYSAAQRSLQAVQGLDFSDLTEDANELKKINEEVAKIDNAAIKTNLSLISKSETKVKAYEAQLSIKDDKGKYPELLAGLTGAQKTSVAERVNAAIQQTLDDMTNLNILYWKDGQTYFYVPIRHQGFSGLMGNPTSKNKKDYLNGVVRNHVYKINVNQIFGLGTPVIEPDKPIDPERPDDAPDSYITAQIHVLRWRVVSSNVTMH